MKTNTTATTKQKMKVKIEQFQLKINKLRPVNYNYVWLMAFILFTFVQLMITVNASEIATFINETQTYSNYDISNRTGKFLFDALFGISQPQLDSLVDDDDDNEKACDCCK